MKYNFEINKIFHADDRDDAYDYAKWRGEEDRVVSNDDYFKARDLALVRAGESLDTDGSLTEIVDKSTGSVMFAHHNGFSGVVTLLYSLEDLRKHLKEKCHGMKLIHYKKQEK